MSCLFPLYRLIWEGASEEHSFGEQGIIKICVLSCPTTQKVSSGGFFFACPLFYSLNSCIFVGLIY